MQQSFTISIETGNDAFDEAPDHALEHVLDQVKSMMIGTRSLGKLYDYNGNCVGKVEYK